MKRILLILSTIFIFCTMTAFASSPQDGTLDLLRELNIMQGDPDGNMRLEDSVTRAEFTKVAVASSDYRNYVATNLSISPFPDVTYRHWAAPYVRVGVSNGLLSGYPDATFKPDEPVLYEEAITIMLRALGYTNDDFGSSWPYGQIGMANNLDMTDNIECEAGQTMNRGQVAQLIYNTLSVKKKGQNNQLVNGFDVQITEDVTLIADSNDDSSIAADEIFTSNGTYKTDNPIDRKLLGLKGDIAVKNNKKLIAFMPNAGDNSSDDYVVYSTLGNKVMAYHNNSLTQIDIEDSTTVYKGKSQTTFASLKNSLEMGDILRVKKVGTNIDYITWQNGNLEGPVTVSATGWGSNWNITSSTSVMRNGVSSSYSALQNLDIAYYLKDLDLVLAYSNKVTGIYEKASPNADAPTSITISGKEYSIEGGNAFKKLSSGGQFVLGDTIIALLGKDGRIADVVSSASTVGEEIVGYVLDSGRKTYETGTTDTYTGYYLKLVLPSGETTEYTTTTDYGNTKNKVVKITFSNGSAKATIVSNSSGKASGTFDWNARKLGNYRISPNIAILDIGTVDTYENSVYAKVYPQRLDNVKLSGDRILYYALDGNGEISKLILDNVTGDGFSYGLMIKATNDIANLTGTYEYIVNGQIYSLTTRNRVYNISTGAGIKIAGNAGNPDSVGKMEQISEKIVGISSSAITTAMRTYPISSNVTVYKKSSIYTKEYTQIPLSDILDKDDISITAYYDKLPSSGGQIRVIVAY